MTIKRKDFQKASALIHEFLLKLNEDTECAELRDALNLALLHMQRYYRLLRSRTQHQQQHTPPANGATTPSSLTQSLRGLSPMTPFRDTPDKFVWKWINVESPKVIGTLPADIDKEQYSRIPLFVQAAKNSDNNTLMALLEKDPDCIFEIDTLGRNALMYAVHQGHLDTIQLLLDHGTDVNATALDGSTVVHIACHDNQHEALVILIHYGANLQSPDHLGRTPIHWACATPQRNCLKLLLENGVSTKLRDSDGMTPSMWACRMDNIEHFELLTSAENQGNAGANDDDDDDNEDFEVDYTGKTWVHWSVRRSDPHECLKTLLTEDAANWKDKDGKTAILTAADQGSLAATKIVLEIAGNRCLDHRDNNNRTPLILATIGGHGEVVNCLLSSGADFAAVDNFSATAWDYARNRQLHYCMLILASYIRQLTSTDGGATTSGDEMVDNRRIIEDNPHVQRAEEVLGMNQLQINGDSQEQMYYSSQPVSPHPPKQPITPRTPRAPKRPQQPNHTPSTPRQQYTPTSHSHTLTTPRGVPQKRSPSTPVEVREEEQLFERNERDASSAGSTSKRLRGEGSDGSPSRGLSVMSVESFDATQHRQDSADSHRTRPRSEVPPDEPEMPSNSQYIEAAEDGHGEDQESVSIDAMDVSDFDADIDEAGSPRQHQSLPHREAMPQKRQAPPSGPPTQYITPPYNQANQNQPSAQNRGSHPLQPPPVVPQQRLSSTRQYAGSTPNHQTNHSQQFQSPHPPPSRLKSPQHPKPPTRQYVPQSEDLLEGPQNEDEESEHEDQETPSAPVPTPRGKPPPLQYPQAAGRVMPPAHLTPIPMGEPQKRKKRKKRRDRPDHISDPPQQIAPQNHNSYSLPANSPGPIVHPPPSPMRREPSPQRNPVSPDRGHSQVQSTYWDQGQGYKLGSDPGQSQNQGQGDGSNYQNRSASGVRHPAGKPSAPNRQNLGHQVEQSYSLDQSLKVNKSKGHDPSSTLSPRSSSLPPTSHKSQSLPPPHPKRLPSPDSNNTRQHNKSDSKMSADSRSRSLTGGQRFAHQNGQPPGHGPPSATQNGPLTNTRGTVPSPGRPTLGSTRGERGRHNSPSPPKHKPPSQPPPWSQQHNISNGQLPSPANTRQY